MFELSEKNQTDRRILKCDYIRYSPSEISTIKSPKSQTYINMPREDSVNRLLDSRLILNFDELHAATNNRYAIGDTIRLVNLDPVALFSTYSMTKSSRNHIEEFSHAHIICLLYILITIARDTDDLCIGFDLSRDRRQREVINNKNIKGKYHLTIMLKDNFGFAEHQEKGTYGLGYRLILRKNNDSAVLNKGNEINNAKIEINSFDWYVPHYTPSLEQQSILSNQIVMKILTELQYIEKSVFMNEKNIQNLWTFELGTQEGINVRIWIIVGFQQSDRQHVQNLNNDTFYRPPVTSTRCLIGSEKYPDCGISLKNDDDDYSQGYDQIKEALGALTKDDRLSAHISHHDFRSSTDGNIIGYNLYVCDIRYQKTFSSAQPIEEEFNFSEIVPAWIYG